MQHIDIVVIGLGYVGLPLAVALAERFPLTGFDIDEGWVEELRQARDRTREIEPAPLAASSLRGTSDLRHPARGADRPCHPGRRPARDPPSLRPLRPGQRLHLPRPVELSHFRVERRIRRRIAVVPFGDVAQLLRIERVDWHLLDKPKVEATLGHLAIVTDFSADLPAGWETFLTKAALHGKIVYQVKKLSESLTGRVDFGHLSENSFGSLLPPVAIRT